MISLIYYKFRLYTPMEEDKCVICRCDFPYGTLNDYNHKDKNCNCRTKCCTECSETVTKLYICLICRMKPPQIMQNIPTGRQPDDPILYVGDKIMAIMGACPSLGILLYIIFSWLASVFYIIPMIFYEYNKQYRYHNRYLVSIPCILLYYSLFVYFLIC